MMKNNNKGLRQYHYQAGNDIYADIQDLSERIINTTMKEIMAAYRDELMSDLLAESQEAY